MKQLDNTTASCKSFKQSLTSTELGLFQRFLKSVTTNKATRTGCVILISLQSYIYLKHQYSIYIKAKVFISSLEQCVPHNRCSNLNLLLLISELRKFFNTWIAEHVNIKIPFRDTVILYGTGCVSYTLWSGNGHITYVTLVQTFEQKLYSTQYFPRNVRVINWMHKFLHTFIMWRKITSSEDKSLCNFPVWVYLDSIFWDFYILS